MFWHNAATIESQFDGQNGIRNYVSITAQTAPAGESRPFFILFLFSLFLSVPRASTGLSGPLSMYRGREIFDLNWRTIATGPPFMNSPQVFQDDLRTFMQQTDLDCREYDINDVIIHHLLYLTILHFIYNL